MFENYILYAIILFSGVNDDEGDDEKENRETSPSIKTTNFIIKEREALSANDTNTSGDISGINSLNTSKADSSKESDKPKLKVSVNICKICKGFYFFNYNGCSLTYILF